MIEGVQVTPLRKLPDERGYVMHLLRSDSPAFRGFGEVYFSGIYQGVVKGWHLHRVCTLNYAAVRGMVKVVLFDARDGSATKGELMELFIGDHDYQLVTVPPGVWNGIKGVSAPDALVAICLDVPYDPAEVVRVDPFENEIPYDWSLKHG